MRIILLPAIAAMLVSGCTQKPRDMLTGGAWTCRSKSDDSQMALTFEKDGKLTGKLAGQNPDPSLPDAISLKMELGGSWSLAGDSDLTFGFKDAKVIEAKRAGQDLPPDEAEYFKHAFTSDPELKARITTLTSSKLVLAQNDKDEPLDCTR